MRRGISLRRIAVCLSAGCFAQHFAIAAKKSPAAQYLCRGAFEILLSFSGWNC